MTDRLHITAGRTALRALLIATVLTTGVVGTTGTAAAALDGKGNDACPCVALSVGNGPAYAVEAGHLGERTEALAVGLTTGRVRDPDTVVLATSGPH